MGDRSPSTGRARATLKGQSVTWGTWPKKPKSKTNTKLPRLLVARRTIGFTPSLSRGRCAHAAISSRHRGHPRLYRMGRQGEDAETAATRRHLTRCVEQRHKHYC